jgi:crotonobetainyl-CoA:carnitine CoA-transferase CaiB-like acyl-CoA transferase
MLVEYVHPVLGEVRTLGMAFEVGGYSPTYRRAPELGEDTDALLDELGFDADERSHLAREGAFGRAGGSPDAAQPDGDPGTVPSA